MLRPTQESGDFSNSLLERVRFIVQAIASSHPEIVCQVAEAVRANYLDRN
ncbi:MAG: hypothetical protein AB4426_04785 [Xenococcaceae cyanobacterium]